MRHRAISLGASLDEAIRILIQIVALQTEVLPPPSPKKYWTRKGIAEWLVDRLTEDVPALVGVDHGFSFPLRYFEVHGLLPDWPRFLDDL